MRYLFLLLVALALAACGAAAPAATPTPAAAQLRYLLPGDFFDTFITVDEEQIFADEQGFLVRFMARGAAPGPQSVVTIAGGLPAQGAWEAAKAAGESDTNEPTIIRAVDGWITSSETSLTITWVEAGYPYLVNIPSLDDAALKIFVNNMADLPLDQWRDQVGIE